MFKSYFKIAVRHLLRHKLFSAINIFCLAIGIAFCLVIGIYVLNQYNINAPLRNVERQYIIKSHWAVKEMGLEITTFGPLAKTLRDEYPSLVANYYRYNPVTNVVSAGDKFFKENIAIGDTSFISMYGFHVLHGNQQRPFPDNSSAVITETMALKLFGRKDAVNNVVSILTTQNGVRQDYKVSAVVKDIPYNSVTNLIGDTYSVFVPTADNRYYAGGDPSQYWNSAYEIAAVELQPGISPADLAKPVKQILAKYTTTSVQNNLSVEFAPVREYYLNDHNGAPRKMIRTLSLTALFILLMAVINFVNINIGSASNRLREIGLRKVFGGIRRQLVLQFLMEALILTAIAAAFSLLLYEAIRPVFRQVLNSGFQSFLHFDKLAFAYFLALIIGTGLIAGMYPAFVLSSLHVTNAVKGKMSRVKGGLALRKTMLVVQFTLGIVVFISALTVSRQVSYIFSKDLGYTKDQVLVLSAFPKQWDSAGVQKMLSIRDAMNQLPHVQAASLSFEIPDRKPPNSISMEPVNGGQTVLIASCGVDEKYIAAFGLKMLSGSPFNQDGGYIPRQLILIESAVKALGLTVQSAVGTQIKVPGLNSTSTVAGVVKDFNYSSLQEPIGPIAFFHVRDAASYRYLSLKLQTPNISETIMDIKREWNKLSPNAPFDYSFMDEKFQSLYQSELQLRKAAKIATVLNLIIIFLGVFGVVSFTLSKRTKEIAVRKVLGAGLSNIIRLFIKDYAWLLLLANCIAWPVTYMITNKWLESYAYRIRQDIMPYLVVCIAVFLVAFSIIAIQCAKAAIANPVKNLRSE